MKKKEEIIEKIWKNYKKDNSADRKWLIEEREFFDMEIAPYVRQGIEITLLQQKQEIFNKIFDFITEEIKRADELRKEELRERFIVLASKISEFKITLDENVSNN